MWTLWNERLPAPWQRCWWVLRRLRLDTALFAFRIHCHYVIRASHISFPHSSKVQGFTTHHVGLMRITASYVSCKLMLLLDWILSAATIIMATFLHLGNSHSFGGICVPTLHTWGAKVEGQMLSADKAKAFWRARENEEQRQCYIKKQVPINFFHCRLYKREDLLYSE